MNVCYCGNSRIFLGAFLSAFSVARYAKEPVTIYLLTADISYIKKEYVPLNEEQRATIEKAIKSFNEKNKVILLDASNEFKNLFADGRNTHSMYTPFCFLRLLMDVVPGIPERLIYMDTDTVALDDLSPLYHLDFGEKKLAMVHDALREKGYANSGVILFDMKAIKEDGSFQKCREYLFSHKLMMPDQDTINRIYKNDRLFLPRKYNEQRKLKKDTVIRHYCQSIRVLPYFHIIKAKPWQWEKFSKAYKKECELPIFREFVKASGLVLNKTEENN